MNLKNISLSGAIFLTSFSLAHAQDTNSFSLNFNPGKYETQTLKLDEKSFTIRAYEKIVYVANPVDTAYQIMNIYIPEEYFAGKKINGYTSLTAPIFFPNKIGGYMPGKPATAMTNGSDGFAGGPGGMPPNAPQGGAGRMGNGPMGDKQQSAVLLALSKGYVVASAGARGRTNQDKNGTYTGKAPAVVVDLKAAIRYLKYNDKNMPGNANKIISNGTSAGGALSVLIGATGNNADYEPYLKELGAANATDDIFAVSAYCPITNLDNADAAYEWQFNGVNTFEKRGFPPGNSTAQTNNILSSTQVAVSEKLKVLFPAYVNSLGLKDENGKAITLDEDGNGNFKELVKTYVMASAQKASDKGTDLSSLKWITISNGKVTGLDFGAYVRYMQRMKTPPSFDGLDLSTGENQLFGTATIDKQHFTKFATDNSTVKATQVDAQIVKMMNPMYYIGQAGTTTSKYRRIRHGSKDKDTSLGILLS